MFGFTDLNFNLEFVCILCSCFSFSILHPLVLLAVIRTECVWCYTYMKSISYKNNCR